MGRTKRESFIVAEYLKFIADQNKAMEAAKEVRKDLEIKKRCCNPVEEGDDNMDNITKLANLSEALSIANPADFNTVPRIDAMLITLRHLEEMAFQDKINAFLILKVLRKLERVLAKVFGNEVTIEDGLKRLNVSQDLTTRSTMTEVQEFFAHVIQKIDKTVSCEEMDDFMAEVGKIIPDLNVE
ncbi:MAG: hypothetical protein IT292_01160 [Deltaproteobacteria bacterium]|nr:hypothetical protein [Deltaproteobacteria bacterium]